MYKQSDSGFKLFTGKTDILYFRHMAKNKDNEGEQREGYL